MNNLLLWLGSILAGLGSLAVVIALDVDVTYPGPRRHLVRYVTIGASAACLGFCILIAWAFGGDR